MVAEAPTARSPVHVNVGAANSALPVEACTDTHEASSSTSDRSSVTFSPTSGTWPVLVIVTVYVTESPGFADRRSVFFSIVSSRPGVSVLHDGSVEPGGQLLPGVYEVTLLLSFLSPGLWLL